jgi:hypothetical protein
MCLRNSYLLRRQSHLPNIVDNLGIGTATPNRPLHIAAGKVLRIEGGSATDAADYFSFGGGGSFGIDAPGVPDGRFVVRNSGNVGIGAPNPNSKLEVNGSLAVTGNGFLTVSGNYNNPNGTQNFNYSVFIGVASPSSVLAVSASAPGALGPIIALTNTSGGGNAAAAIDFYTFDPGEGVGPDNFTSPSSRIEALDDGNFANDIVFLSNKPGAASNELVEQMRITSGGELTSPGGLRVSSGMFVRGDVKVSGDVLLTGADCAEHFDAVDGRTLEPGTVVVIDDDGALCESQEAYDTKAAGVISGGGDYTHGIILDNQESQEGRVPVALVGKVYCKVDARYSPIKVGDLLTTSPTAGHAMKATDSHKAFGAVIGKALKSLAEGSGLIPIIIALQ